MQRCQGGSFLPRRLSFPDYQARVDELYRALKEARWTHAKLAKRGELETYQIGRYLGGVLPEDHENLEKFGKALGVPWEYLLVGREGYNHLKTYFDQLAREAAHPPPPARHPPSRPKTIAIRKEAAG